MYTSLSIIKTNKKQSKNIAIYPHEFLIRLTFLLWLGKMKVFYIDFTFEKLRQYRIILSADTASEVRQMLSQKRR